jgi:hypothetical protein
MKVRFAGVTGPGNEPPANEYVPASSVPVRQEVAEQIWPGLITAGEDEGVELGLGLGTTVGVAVGTGPPTPAGFGMRMKPSTATTMAIAASAPTRRIWVFM